MKWVLVIFVFGIGLTFVIIATVLSDILETQENMQEQIDELKTALNQSEKTQKKQQQEIYRLQAQLANFRDVYVKDLLYPWSNTDEKGDLFL